MKLHQEYPTYVIECEGTSIALDGEVAQNINVWIEGEASAQREPMGGQGARDAQAPNFRRPLWRWRFGARDGTPADQGSSTSLSRAILSTAGRVSGMGIICPFCHGAVMSS